MKCVDGVRKIGAHCVAGEDRFRPPPSHACALTMEVEPDERTGRATNMSALRTHCADLSPLDAAVLFEPPTVHLDAPGVLDRLEAGEILYPQVVGHPVLWPPVSPDDQEHLDTPVRTLAGGRAYSPV